MATIIETPTALTITFGNIRGTVFARQNSPTNQVFSRDNFYNVSMEIYDYLRGVLNGGYDAQEIKVVISKNPDFALEVYDIDSITNAAEMLEIIVDQGY